LYATRCSRLEMLVEPLEPQVVRLVHVGVGRHLRQGAGCGAQDDLPSCGGRRNK
jgi:hypothetical protein